MGRGRGGEFVEPPLAPSRCGILDVLDVRCESFEVAGVAYEGLAGVISSLFGIFLMWISGGEDLVS